MDGSMEVQTTSTSSSPPASEEAKAMMQSSNSPSANNNDVNRSFDCAICYETLTKPGPSLQCFTFGKLLINVSQLPFLEREHIYREFCLADQCFTDGNFDCDKIVSTICGHIFHSGCIREWFFMKRMERFPKCPLCNRRTNYEECRLLYPLSCNNYENDNAQIDEEEAEMRSLNETEYSDISCTSSSWPSDNESSSTEDDGGHDEDEGDDMYEEMSPEEVLQNDLLIEENLHDFIDGTVGDAQHANDDDILYSPVYILTNERDDSGQKTRDKIRQFVDGIVKFDLVHVITLMNVLKGACKLYHYKKEKFLVELAVNEELIEDEYLEDMDSQVPVPLGYELVGLLFIAGLFIWAGEKYMDIFTRKEENYKSISTGVMMLHYLTFDIFATLCLLITRDMLFF